MRSLKLIGIGVPAQIRIGHFPNTSLKRHRLSHFVHCHECETWSFIPKGKHRLRVFEKESAEENVWDKQERKRLQKISLGGHL
jgi:hypothetical protein